MTRCRNSALRDEFTRRYLNSCENQLSPGLIGLSLTTSPSANFSTLVGSGPPKLVLPNLQPAMAESPGFRVYTPQLNAQLRLRFPFGSPIIRLTLLQNISRRPIIQKVRSHPIRGSHCLYVHGFRFFSLPSPGFFSPFPQRYWFTISQSEYLAPGGWSPHIQRQDTTCPTLLIELTGMCIFVRGCHLYRALSRRFH